MRRSIITTALTVSCLALVLGAPGGAAASGREFYYPGSFSFEAHLPSADGYDLYLRAHNRHEIELDVEREGFAEPYVTMTYRANGRISDHGIKSDLGRFGQIDLHFVGRPQTERFHDPDCTPRAVEVTRLGVLRGVFEFESLDRKVKLSVHRLEGHTAERPERTCKPQPRIEREGPGSFFADRRPVVAEGKGEGFVADFSALAHIGGRTIEIYAIKLQNEIVPDMAATSTRRYGRVLLSTSVHAPESEEEVPGEGVLFSIPGRGTRPRHATLSASGPFSGTGTYIYRPGSAPTFLGSLKVRIPGEGTLPLAGPEFHAALCNYSEVRRQRACEKTVGPAHTV